MECKHCGGEFSEERSALGYDYCTKPACVQACLKPLDVVAVHVNKASDQYVLREHLDLPAPAPPISIDPGWASLPGATGKRPARANRRKTTLERLNELEAELDASLAVESDPERRNKLVHDYNAKLWQFDIRYRRIKQRR